MREMTFEKFSERWEGPCDGILRALENYPDATALVVFENQQMDSSSFGNSTVVPVGPSNTFKTVGECDGKWLNDLPSQRQYPIGWVSRDVLIDGTKSIAQGA